MCRPGFRADTPSKRANKAWHSDRSVCQSPADLTGELMTVKLRYKEPDGDTSKLIEVAVTDEGLTLSDASDDFVFAASVASFGMLLRGSEHAGDFTHQAVLEMATPRIGDNPDVYRREFLDLVQRAIELQATRP
jgi:Ca-activated chloride channel family protein